MTIKKLIPALMIAGSMAVVMPSCKSKVADSDVKAKVENAVAATPGITVDVNDGVVTLSGTATSEADKANAEAAVKALDDKSGVKSVVNNITVQAPTAAPVINTVDSDLTTKVVDATKDYPTVQATVANGVITVTGELEQAKVQNLKMALDNLKPQRVDMSALKVK